MEREIKFRLWHDSSKQMFYNTMSAMNILIGLGGEVKDVYLKEDITNEIKKLQYTGLKDKNGKEIYEGDVCNLIPEDEWKDYINMIGIREVRWNKEESAFQFNSFVPMGWGGFKSIEIIGNIYENSELLK